MAVNRLNVGATNQLLAKASTGQSTNILELQNTAGVTVAGVDASGNGVGGLAHPPTFKNLIINGAMQVAQRGTSVTGVTSGGYLTADRWNTTVSSLGTWTQTSENDAPTGSGFRKSTKILCTTADASPSAGDYMIFNQAIEGQNVQHLLKGTSSAKQLTISFWVKSNVTGTYIVEMEDRDNSRDVSASYTINASATWEKKTITFPADTTGALDNDNAASFAVYFWLGAGSTYTGGSSLQTSWGTGTNTRAVGQTNLAASTNNYWQVTGVQLEVGNTATEFEFLPADVELARCQRYYFRNTADVVYAIMGHGAAKTSTLGYINFPTPTQLRTTPSSIDWSTLQLWEYDESAFNVTVLTIVSTFANKNNIGIVATVASGLVANVPLLLVANNSATAYVGISAEL
jgi:hypothetical protein